MQTNTALKPLKQSLTVPSNEVHRQIDPMERLQADFAERFSPRVNERCVGCSAHD